MKKKATLALTFLLLATFACGLPTGGDTTDSGSTDENSPAATQEQASTPEIAPGPETIDLGSPALYSTDGYIAYQINTILQYKGVDASGNEVISSIKSIVEQRTAPEEAIRSVLAGGDPADTIEYIKLGDLIFNVYGGKCAVFSADSQQQEFDPSEQMFNMQEFFMGQATRAETGVVVEGIVTDRYALTQENLSPQGDGVPTLQSGDVYVSSETGNVIKIEVIGTTRTDQYGMDSNQDTAVNMSYIFNPSEDVVILPPEGCLDTASGLDAYPVMDGATGLSSVSGTVVYQVNGQLKDVLNFYRTEMPAQGYELTEDISSDTVSFATLRFTKDGQIVKINAIQNGGEVSVNINNEQ